jgi:hypothetical protein
MWKSKNDSSGVAPKNRPDRNANSDPIGNNRWLAGAACSWAYDWSIPGECASYRIVLAARTAKLYKSKLVMATAIDSSLRQCKKTADAAGGANLTEGTDGTMCENPDARGNDVDGSTDTKVDNIFGGTADGLNAGAEADVLITDGANTGSSRRCLLR